MLTNFKLFARILLEAALCAQTAKANALADKANALADCEEAEAADAAMWRAEDDRRAIWLAIKEIDDQWH